MRTRLSAICLLLVASTEAATVGTLLLRGTVPTILAVTITPEPGAITLPLETTQSDLLVATITEQSNSMTGYKINISSANEGQLVHETTPSSAVSYVLKYDGTAVDLSGEDFVYSSPAAVNESKDVTVSYTGVPHSNLLSGDYEDTITFTISAN